MFIRFTPVALTLAIVGLLAISANTQAEQPECGKDALHFKLRTHAEVILPSPGTGPDLLFEVKGPGTAHAKPRNVALRTARMTHDSAPVGVKILWNNPLPKDGKDFQGRGVAIIKHGDRTVRVPVAIKGQIERGDNGPVIHGRFHDTGDQRVTLRGVIRGQAPRPDTDTDTDD